MARPRKQIDQKQFENLCGLQCTKEEICDWFEVSDKTLDRWCNETYEESFSDVFSQKRGKGKISLRRMQMRLAEKNASMAIFLGKQYLGQTDKVETVFDARNINEVNKKMFENVADVRNIEDLE